MRCNIAEREKRVGYPTALNRRSSVTAAQKRSPRSKSVTFITMQRNFPIAIAPWVGQFSCGLVTAFIKRSRLKPRTLAPTSDRSS